MIGKEKKEKKTKQDPNTPEEQSFLNLIQKNQNNAEAVRGGNTTESTNVTENGIEDIWEDEYKMLVGDQWSTTFAYRTKAARKTRPNSVDNFIFPAVTNSHANITSSTPDVVIEGIEKTDIKIAEKLTFAAKFNDQRNKFKATWKKMVLQFIAYGPLIGGVFWDNDWIGGTGPNRWIGDVRISNIDRRNIYFDPAIIDLEERLQDCSFIHEKYRKKLSWIKDSWPDKGEYVSSEGNDSELQDEGQEPEQAWLIRAWHRGTPQFVSDEKRQEFLNKAAAESDPYKAQDYKDMAAGILKGIHCAYVANGVFLGYEPYVYDDGLYPFVYKTCYYDENSQHGFGEIRNIKIPQVMHNKADEIEIEAMSREGLGGMYYSAGAVSPNQKEEILKNNGKGGMWQEVQNINGLKEREGVQTPAALVGYKEHKQRMVETISQNTPIQQGMAPGANMPYKAIAELGARTDIRTKSKIEILEDFLIEINKLRINRFVQFYTEDRYYRIRGKDDKIVSGTINRNEMLMTWEREPGKKEQFVPEFDIKVKVMDEKPTDRNYYTNTAFVLFDKQAMTLDDLWYTLEEGKFPNKESVIQNVKAQNAALQFADMFRQMPPEMQQQAMQMVQQMAQQGMMDQFLDSLPDEELAALQQLPPEEQQMRVQAMMGGAKSAPSK
jgi:hypothetical protein